MSEKSKENWVTLSSTDEIEIDQIKTVQAGPKKIILVRTETGFFALDSLCPHQGASFEDGVVCKSRPTGFDVPGMAIYLTWKQAMVMATNIS